MDWQPVLDIITQDSKHNGLIQKIKSVRRNEKDIISCLLSDNQIRKLLILWMNKLPKNKYDKCLKQTKAYKKQANEQFRLGNYRQSAYLYTKALQYAIFESEDYFQAITYRSASLFQIEEYEESLKDIEMMKKWQCPADITFKMHRQAAQCFLKLGRRESFEKSLNVAEEFLQKCSSMSDEKKMEFRKSIKQLSKKSVSKTVHDLLETKIPKLDFGNNPSFTSASLGIDVKSDANKGRFVVTNRAIKKKQILFVEMPFAFVLLNHAKFDLVCANCCHMYCYSAIPCSSCADLIFCSVKCKNNAWTNYHQWECAGNKMELWKQIGIAHLALNVFLNCATTPDIAKFNEVQSLVTNIDKVSAEDLLVYSITAKMLMLYLREFTNLFDGICLKKNFVDKFINKHLNFDCNLSTADGKELYVSSLLLRFTLQMICNGHSITALMHSDSGISGIENEQQGRIATAIYPSASKMNHSCDANIINSFMDQYLIIKATGDIPEGGEVLNCYGPHFRLMSKQERQDSLKSQYYFDCQCIPCTDKSYDHFLDRFKAFKCSKCSGPFCKKLKKCLDCGITCLPFIIEYESRLKESKNLFQEAELALQSNEMEKALDKAKQCLTIRQNVLQKYNESIAHTFDLIGKIYASKSQYLQSIKYLEEGLKLIDQRFGSDSMEVAGEINKITDICESYLISAKSNSTEYQNILTKTWKFINRALEILDLNNGPWTQQYKEIAEKKDRLTFNFKFKELL